MTNIQHGVRVTGNEASSLSVRLPEVASRNSHQAVAAMEAIQQLSEFLVFVELHGPETNGHAFGDPARQSVQIDVLKSELMLGSQCEHQKSIKS